MIKRNFRRQGRALVRTIIITHWTKKYYQLAPARRIKARVKVQRRRHRAAFLARNHRRQVNTDKLLNNPYKSVLFYYIDAPGLYSPVRFVLFIVRGENRAFIVLESLPGVLRGRYIAKSFRRVNRSRAEIPNSHASIFIKRLSLRPHPLRTLFRTTDAFASTTRHAAAPI